MVDLWRATRIAFALTLIGGLLMTAVVPTAAEDDTPTSAESHDIRFTDSSGEETPKALGFLVPEGELGAVAAGSVNQSQGGPDLVYFSPGEHLIWYASGILWVGNSEVVATAVDAERQRLAAMGLRLRDVTNWPATLDGQMPQEQDLQAVQQPFARAWGVNWPFVWAAQHNEELIRARESAAVAAARPVPTPAPTAPFMERRESGKGKELAFPARVSVAGFRITLSDGRKCELCFLPATPTSGVLFDGVLNYSSQELSGLKEWEP